MSKVSLGILMAATALIVLAVYFEVSFIAGSTGVVLVVALGYSFVVARREASLMMHAIEVRDAERFGSKVTPEADPAE